ncbi:MAG: hypothetical protein AAGK67_02450 [Pseudomonadota bacterium]
MAKRIILIHGRSTKPCKSTHEKLVKTALLQGLNRVNEDAAKKVSKREVKLDIVYYGDINNRILAGQFERYEQSLSATDPAFDNVRCLPDDGLFEAVERLATYRTFDRRAYRKVLRDYEDSRFLDSAARAVSTIAAITTATLLNEVAIKRATADMGAYLMQRSVGSEVRERLQSPLKRALKNNDDICLVAHSMGCMVSYDVLWKFSRMSEYRDVRENGNRVARWVTLGCPLGEAGVKANLYDSNEREQQDGTDKHPKGIIDQWENFAAFDDFISHDPTMKDDFRAMLKYDHLNSIKDHEKIYNCWVHDGKSNPHKFFGYLANQKVAKVVADWIG